MGALNVFLRILSIATFLVVVGLVWRLWSRQDGVSIPNKAEEKPVERAGDGHIAGEAKK